MNGLTKDQLRKLKKQGWHSKDDMCNKLELHERTLQRWAKDGKLNRMYVKNYVFYKLPDDDDELGGDDDFSSEIISVCSSSHLGIDDDEAEELDSSDINDDSMIEVDKPYWYDEKRDLYLFFLKHKNKPFAVEGDDVRSILSDYSKITGSTSTIEEVSRKIGLSPMTVKGILKALNKTHSSLPFTPEDLSNSSVDELSDELLRVREEKILETAKKKQWNKIKRDAIKWSEFQNGTYSEIFKQIEGMSSNYSVPKISISTKNERDFCAVVTPTDFHYGKKGWSDEVGEEYSREVAEQRLVEKTQESLSLISNYGTPEMFIVGAGSDWFHIDTDQATTTAGTPQDTDGSFAQIYVEGCDLAVKYIDILRSVAPVTILLMEGNHDRTSSISLLNYLYAWYKDDESVQVSRSFYPRQYVLYGESLLGFTHGDKPALKHLPSLMANEASKEWGMVENRIWFTGDKHHEMSLDIGGTQIYQMPCLAGEDRWHTRNGYTTSRKALASYLVDRENGLFASLYASVK